jgi:hypothetical protein
MLLLKVAALVVTLKLNAVLVKLLLYKSKVLAAPL